ncbi:MAG: hypothetical protein FWB74_02150 [Defluviitaleaceae bacterium]|nr:hypothetical protein [Defluviitaleaceae bacterium]
MANDLSFDELPERIKRGIVQLESGKGLVREFIEVQEDNDESELSHPFYSESNMAHLARGVVELRAGRGLVRELIEVDDD